MTDKERTLVHRIQLAICRQVLNLDDELIWECVKSAIEKKEKTETKEADKEEEKKTPCSYPVKMICRGYNSHDCCTIYLCPTCRRYYTSWDFYHEHFKPHDTFTCDCGQLLEVPE